MKNLFLKTISSAIALSMLPVTVFARTDYKQEYHYDNMEDVYRFDLGTFRDTGAVSEVTADWKYYTNLLNKLGFISYSDAGRYLQYGDFVKTLNKLAYNRDIEKEAELTEDAKKNVTMKEAMLQICNVLGFLNIYKESEITEVAYNYDIFKGLTYSEENNITTGEFAVLLWNALNSEYVETNIGTVVTYDINDGCLLENRFSIFEANGLVDGIFGKSIFSETSPMEGTVFIDSSPYISAESGAEQYFGMRVHAFARLTDDDEYVLLYAEPDEKSEYIEIDFDSIEEADSERITYVNEEGNLKKVSISDVTNVIYNSTIKNDKDYILDYENYDGTITLVNSKKGGTVDVAIIKDYSYFAVYSVSAYEEKIHLNYGATLAGNTFIDMSLDECVVCTEQGSESDWESIEANDIIRVIQSEDKKYTEIEVSGEKISSKVTSKDRDSNEVTINGKVYKIAKTYINAPESTAIAVGTTGTFFVSSDGYIAGYLSASDEMYGYIAKSYMNEEDETAVVSVFSQLGQWKDYTLKPEVKVDGRKMTAEDTIKYLKDNKIVYAIIRYTATADGVIKSIDTTFDTIDEISDKERLTPGFKGNVTLSTGGGKYFKETQYSLLDDAVVFKVPTDKNDKNLYSVTPGAGLIGSTVSYVEMYTPNDFKMCKAGISGAAPAEIANENRYWLYVESVSESIDANDEVVDVLNGILFKHSSTEYIEDYSLTCPATLRKQIDAAYPGAIAPGSFLRVNFDKNDVLSAVSVGFKNWNCEEFYTSIYNYYNSMCGHVTAVDPTLGSYGFMNIKVFEKDYIIQPKGSIMFIDSKTHKVYISGISDVRVGDKIFVHYATNSGRIHVVFR